jgi:hypothetical protein
MGVHGRAFMRAFIHACATLLLSLDTRHSSFRPQHELLLLLSLARAAPSLFLNAWRRPLHPSLQVLRLVLETRGSSPGPQHESSRAFMSRAAPLPRVLRAVYRLTPVTYPARARATRAMLATSGDAPAQPGPADARSLRRRPSWRPAQACLDGGVGGPVQQRPCSSRRRPGRRLAHIYGGPAPPWPGSFKRSRQLPLQRLALMAGRHCRGPALLTAALACERLALRAS